MPVTPDYPPAPDFVEWLEARRLDREWTQEHLARQLDVSYGTVRGWLNGRYRPDYEALWKLRVLFDETPFD